MRFWDSVRWRFSSDAAKRYMRRARTLIGQMFQSDKSSQVRHRVFTMPDGAVIRMLDYGGVPIIEITAPEDTSGGCAIEMYSGMVNTDTGTLQHDETWVCGVRPAGGVTVSPTAVTTLCNTLGETNPTSMAPPAWPDVTGDPVLNATTADRIVCMRRLPASLWTGLAQRWVAAQYGNPAGRYAAQLNGDQYDLRVPFGDGVDTDDVHDCRWAGDSVWGIVDLTGSYNLRFVEVFEDRVEFRKVLLSPCAERLIAALRTLRGMAPEVRNRLLSFALSQALPAKDIQRTVDILESDRVEGQPVGYSWKFAHNGREASIVTHIVEVGADFGTAVQYKLDFSSDPVSGLPDVVITEIERENYWNLHGNAGYPFNVLRYGNQLGALVSPAYFDTPLLPAGALSDVATNLFDFDVPAYCWYEGDTLAVMRVSFEKVVTTPTPVLGCGGGVASSNELIGPCPGSECDGCDSAIHGTTYAVTSGYRTTYASRASLSYRVDASPLSLPSAFFKWDNRYTSRDTQVTATYTDTDTTTGSVVGETEAEAGRSSVYCEPEIDDQDRFDGPIYECGSTTAVDYLSDLCLDAMSYQGEILCEDFDQSFEYDDSMSWFDITTYAAETNFAQRGHASTLIVPAGSATGAYVQEYVIEGGGTSVSRTVEVPIARTWFSAGSVAAQPYGWSERTVTDFCVRATGTFFDDGINPPKPYCEWWTTSCSGWQYGRAATPTVTLASVLDNERQSISHLFAAGAALQIEDVAGSTHSASGVAGNVAAFTPSCHAGPLHDTVSTVTMQIAGGDFELGPVGKLVRLQITNDGNVYRHTELRATGSSPTSVGMTTTSPFTNVAQPSWIGWA